MGHTAKSMLLTMAVMLPITLLLFLAVVPFTLFGMHTLPFHRAFFDKQRWLTAHRGKSDWDTARREMMCIRGSMYGHLKWKHLANGTKKSAVVKLLGQPQQTLGRWHKGRRCLEWNLGMCSGIRADYDQLLVCFDKNNVIEYVTHYQT